VPNCKSLMFSEAERSISGDVRDLKGTEMRVVIEIFPTGQSDERNSRHSDRRMKRTCTILCHHQNLGRQF